MSNNLENYSVQEMSIKEQKETEGGFLAFFAFMLVLGLIVGIIQEAQSN